MAKRKTSTSGFNPSRSLVMLSILAILSLILLYSSLVLPAKPLSLNSKAASPNQGSKNLPLKQAQASSSAVLTPSPSTLSRPADVGRVVHVPILTYHYIGNNPHPGKDPLRDNLSVTPDKFDSQMRYLSQAGYNTITFDMLYSALKGRGSLPPKPILLTFDDGYIDFYVNAFPILRQYNLKATSFLPTGKVGTSYYLHWDQIKEMDATGLISFEAHSLDHLALTALSDSQLNFQLRESKKRLEEQLGKKVNFMAYPYGASDARVWRAVKDAGYLAATGTWFGSTESEGNIYDMPRIKIAGDISLEQFKRKFDKAY